ncbi:MBL fold metallo-hydrolase [Singulisphaera sp. Ch08]|uniref:MBL fold metallo-hydrolase n=1 Tax=Singulisphaera sp. Ch08 TaxID=3120278 RepID=A0AAU7C6V0_9BACT
MAVALRCLLLLPALLLCCGAGAPAADGGLDIYFIDVMGGASTLIVTPEKESILTDSGWAGFDDRDPKRIVHALKDVAGCDHLDHLITTHWHGDHFGGVAGVAKLVEIKRFWDHGLPEDNDPDLDFSDGPKPGTPLITAYRTLSEGKRKALRPGDRLPIRGLLETLVVASAGKVIGGPSAPTSQSKSNPNCAELPPEKSPGDRSDNSNSLAVRYRFGNFDFLDCGDLTWNHEAELVCPTNRIGSIDLFRVTKHGFDTSNNPVFLKTIAPTVAVMNNGPRKGGSPGTIHRLKEVPSIRDVFALHKNEATGPEDNADPKLTANRDPGGGEFIHVHVAPDGSKFTVRIGKDGPTRTYDSK